MIDVSKSAADEIKKMFGKSSDTACIRITTAGEGCGGPILKLEEGKNRENDEVIRGDGFEIAADKALVESLGGIKVQYTPSHWGGGSFAIGPLVSLRAGCCGDCRC